MQFFYVLLQELSGERLIPNPAPEPRFLGLV